MIKIILIIIFTLLAIREFWLVMNKSSSGGHSQSFSDLEIKVKKICLNADLQIKVIPGNKERFFISSKDKHLILATESSYLGNYRTQKFSPNSSVRCVSDYDINKLMETTWSFQVLFNSKTEVLKFIADKFAGYENYSDTTEIHLGNDASPKESEDVMKLKETDVISKMLEAERTGDKELELAMLNKWEANYKIKSDE